MKFSKMMKAIVLSISLFSLSLTQVFAADPTSPAKYTGTDGTQTYVANNAPTQSTYDFLASLVYQTYQDLLDTFYDLFVKAAAAYNGFASKSPYFQAGANPESWGVVTYQDSTGMLSSLYAQKQGDGWVIDAQRTGKISLPATPPVPIDGGASLLLAAGAAYGLKRLRRRKGETSEN